MMSGRQASEEANWLEQKKVLTENRNYIVENLDADDVIDHLIQEKILGHVAAQQVQLIALNRTDRNRIIVDQVMTAGPGAFKKFCNILKKIDPETEIYSRSSRKM